MNNITTIHSMAGYCHELALWKMLVDLCKTLLEDESQRTILSPLRIRIDGNDFKLEKAEDQDAQPEFIPPEGVGNLGETGIVWSLGALVCFASSGHFIFGGRGGSYQRNNPTVGLPVLRKEHSALTPLVQRCLCFSPSQRISLKDLYEEACKGMERAKNRPRVEAHRLNVGTESISFTSDEIWPEKMY